MIEFADKPEEEIDPFEQYFSENIEPLIEEENKTKQKYRSKFWGYFFSVIFLLSVNTLIVLFNALMHHKPLSWEQLFLVSFGVMLLVLIPIRSYNKLPKSDIFDAFLKFYGGWEHSKNSHVNLVHSPIIPEHDAVGARHEIKGKFQNSTIEIRDTYYTLKSKIVSSGVVLYLTFADKFDGSLLMYDRKGFYRKNKREGYEYYNNRVDIPAVNYFNVFVSSEKIGEQLMHNLFLENLLDLKDAYRARNVYLQAEENYVRVYLEGSEIYIDNYKFWGKMVDKNRFLEMHRELEKTDVFVQTVMSLTERK